MLAMQTADVAVMVIYLLAVAALGVWAGRKIRTAADFFMPRRFGKAMMIMHSFGTGTHADQAVGVASKTYTAGLSGIWYQWLFLFPTPFYWMIAAALRRFRAVTTADVFELRFGRGAAMLFAVVGSGYLMMSIGLMLKGSSAILEAGTMGALSANWTIAAMTVLFVAYGAVGGLSAAIVTDFVQGLMTVVFSVILLPSILVAVGGMKGLHERLADPKWFSLVVTGKIGWFYVAMLAFNGLVGIVAQPHTMGNCAAGRTEMDGRVGFMGGNLVKRFCTVAWCLTGLAAVAYFAGRHVEPDHVYGQAAAEFLPAILPGLLGVFLACLVASVMSSCDSFMVATSALLTENVYRPLAPGRSEDHYVGVGRVLTVVVVAGGMGFAYLLPGVVEGLELIWQAGPIMGVAFWMGLLWRRTNAAGVWASALAVFAVLLVTAQGVFLSWLDGTSFAQHLELVRHTDKGLKMYLPWQMTFYLSAGVLAGIVASLLTPPVPKEKLDRYYALLDTPVRPGEDVPGPCRLPDGAAPRPRRNLLPFAGLYMPMPSRTSIFGFLAGCAVVAAVIYSVYLIAHI